MPNIPQDLYDALLTADLIQDYKRDELLAKIDLWQMQVAAEKEKSRLVANNLFDMFDKASKTLKYPKITFLTPGLNHSGKLQFYLAGAKSAYTGTIQITDSRSYGQNEWYGRIHRINGAVEFSRVSTAPIREKVYAILRDPLGEAKTSGQKFSNCCFCNREIINANSLAVGYGPICAERYGLPWEGTAEEAKKAREED